MFFRQVISPSKISSLPQDDSLTDYGMYALRLAQTYYPGQWIAFTLDDVRNHH